MHYTIYILLLHSNQRHRKVLRFGGPHRLNRINMYNNNPFPIWRSYKTYPVLHLLFMYMIIVYVITEPSAPQSLIASDITYTTISVSWRPPLMPNGIILRYDLEFKETNDPLFTRRFPSPTQRNYVITDLSPGTTYVFRIAAVTIVGHGPFTTNMTNTTLSKFSYALYSYIAST